MTREEAKEMLIAKKKCIENETSAYGCCHDCYSCDLCYEQGNMGEQKEALQIAINSIVELEKRE